MYIYKITNKINGKIYVGQCKYDVTETQSYYGSGKLILRAIKKYGKENFFKEILRDGIDNQQQLDDEEINWIHALKSNDRNVGYNVSTGGNGGNLGDEVNVKISQTITKLHKEGNVYSNDWRNSLSESQTGRVVSDDTKAKISKSQLGEKGYWYGKSHPESAKTLKRGKVPWNKGMTMNDEFCKLVSDALKGNEPWNKGCKNVYSDETLQKMSESAKNRNMSIEAKQRRNEKISKRLLENHPNSKQVVDTRDNMVYKNGKEFRGKNNNKTGNPMTYYRFKKLLDKGVIFYES